MLQITEVRGAEDLSMDIDVLFGSDNDMKQLSFVKALNGGLKPTSYKHEWQDDALIGETLTISAATDGTEWDTATQATGLGVPAGDIAKLKIGDIIQLNEGNEQVRVSAIDTSANTISATRAWGGTATAQGETEQTAYVIGNAQEDGSDPVDPAMTTPTERYNYIQIFENPYHVSRLLNKLKISNAKEFVRQRGLALKSLISKLNHTFILGTRANSGKINTMNGIKNVVVTSYNINGSLTKEKLYLALNTFIEAGGNPDQIHAGHKMIGWLEQLCSADGYERVPMKHAAQFTVKKIDLLGYEIELHADKHMDTDFNDGDYYFIDSGKVKYGAIMPFAPYEVDRNGKQLKDHIIGGYTIEVRNPAGAVMRAYGATGI